MQTQYQKFCRFDFLKIFIKHETSDKYIKPGFKIREEYVVLK